MFVTDDEDLRTRRDAGHEVMTAREFTTELVGAIDAGVHFSTQGSLSVAEGRHDVTEQNVIAYHQYVHVAFHRFTACGNRAVDEGEANPSNQR